MPDRPGSIAVFSGVVMLRSGPAFTDRSRRVYIAHYSKEIITAKDDAATPQGAVERFLDGGRVVAELRPGR
ncbi:hypothetical protein ACIA8E_33995 [Streptomyces sp. NPDC051664]|uniref:hypothetical protein n=1 Tax=Streptomyces sp. NPDC051664 TaxID=3365668 RepID=UPI0037B59D27